ncbi:hypothetical protein DY000_02010610 [Brassica cretica]|uniref:F-box domain-containing protein n=1 Tax=Brassica cretica TaxID=69181 RepID=A0ABQ7BYS9_BRACR|nr:hypothetical protein DY000_02010610 [Brassica cretica]
MMTIANLPNDLEWEILARVPAKSLRELKTTCKRWYALFRDLKFVEKNNKTSKSPRESMFLTNNEVYSIAGDLHKLYINGVVEPYIEFTEETAVVIWNPCTGETKMIKPRTRYQIRDRFALGYDDSRRGYKILRCRYYQNEGKVWFVECEMYELSSDSWRVVESFTHDYGMYCSGVSLRGDTYFAAGGKEMGFFLMKFDFTEERFVRLPLPFQSFDPEDTAVLSVVRDEKLSVCHQDILAWSNVMRIWVTHKVDEEGGKEISWRKDFVLEVDFDKFQLPCVVNVSSFLLDEDKKAAVCCEIWDEEMKGE